MPDTLPPRNHNQPPDLAAEATAGLQLSNKELVARRDELIGSLARAPEVIADAETANKIADLIKLISACANNAEGARVDKKEPFLAAGRAVDGFFKGITEPLAKAKQALNSRLTVWQRKVADEERKRREAEAERQRQEEERLRLEAEAAAAAMKTEADLKEAVALENQARQAAANAEVASQAVAAKPAELSRSRSDIGSVASLRTEWVGEMADRDRLDLNALREHIPAAALEQAIRAFVRAGGRELPGAKIYERTMTVVR